MTRQQKRLSERKAGKKTIELRAGNFDKLRPKAENEAIGNIQEKFFTGLIANSEKMNTTQDENIKIISFLAEAFNMVFQTPGMGIKEARQIERDFPLETITKLIRS